MNKVIITCDSTCDMTQAQLNEYGIRTIPLYVRIQDNEYRDGIDITSDVMFEKIKECGQLPKTAAVSFQDYIDFWKPLRDEGYEIVHLTISGDMSVCFQNCRTAAEELGGVYAVDSRNLSTGISLLAITAANLAKEIEEDLDNLKNKNYIILINKTDLASKLNRDVLKNYIEISVLDNKGIDCLKEKILV